MTRYLMSPRRGLRLAALVLTLALSAGAGWAQSFTPAGDGVSVRQFARVKIGED